MEKEDRAPNQLQVVLQKKGASWSGFMQQVFTRPAYTMILISNVAIFFIPGLDLKHQAVTLLYIYLVHSLLIGAVHVIKLNFYRFAPATRSNDWKNPRAISLFFIVHYGFFHLVYTFFIPWKGVNWEVLLYGTSINLAVLIINTLRHYPMESSGKYNANDFMFLPYLRIIPIHIAIILGGFFSAVGGSFAPVIIVLAAIKTLLELFLEYLQSLGVSFMELSEADEKK